MSEEEKEFINLEEFKEYCKKFDDNITKKWDFIKFKIVCSCGSDNIVILHTPKDTAMGSEYTGEYTTSESEFGVKCKRCGNAMVIRGFDD